jgi:cysteinyl-tRNA synthetase
MGLCFFNTLTRSLEPFVPRDPDGKKVGLYCCGPTVYDRAHIGNFRTFLFADLVRRYLEFRGFEVFHVMNITDVEDKIIARVRQTGIPLSESTRQLEAQFLEDHQQLNCLRPHAMPRATEHITAIIDLIVKLIDAGVAYRAGDGSVYFSIEKYRQAGRRYGQLVNLNVDAMRPGSRVSQDEYDKEAVADFALWKARVDTDGDVFWASPWGEGRPGWHIECSAMSMELLGPSFDLHLGGEDLVFPHHEDEIAQSEAAGLQRPSEPFVKYWLHGAHLLVEGRKMSKSLGNVFTLADLLAKGANGREIRYALLTAHYRETFNFTLENLIGARKALSRIDECVAKLGEIAGPVTAPPDTNWIDRFTAAMDNDLNVSSAWGTVFDRIRDLNRLAAANTLQPAEAAAALAAWNRLESVLGVGQTMRTDEAPAEVMSLITDREAARKSKDFARADALRGQLSSLGWGIEDTPKGPRPKRILQG